MRKIKQNQNPLLLTANLAIILAPAPSPRPTTFFTLKYTENRVQSLFIQEIPG